MIRLIFGDVGTGKSTHIFDLIKADYQAGKRSVLIVPEQETVLRERQIASLLPSRAQLFCEATNFTRLANSVFRAIGGLKTNYISKSGKNLIMYRAICECRERLTEYKIPLGHEKGCIKSFLEAIGELKSYSVTMESLEKAALELENESLKNRLRDIITIWSSYESILSERFSDPYDDTALLAKAISENNYFSGTSVYFDSFYGYTLSQFGVLESIISSASDVTFAFDCPSCAKETTVQFAKIAKTSSNVISLCKRLNKEYTITELDKDLKHKTNDLKELSAHIWDFTKSGLRGAENITLARCSDEFEECEYVSGEIKRLIESGYKYSEIAVIARNLDTYRGILDYTMQKYDIPHFLSSPSDWLTKPLIKMIFAALSFVHTQRGQDLITFAKSPYIDIDKGELDRFESYITKWNIYGSKFKNDDYWASNPDGFVEDETDSQKASLEKILKTRQRLLSSISVLESPFECGKTVGECCLAVFDFLKKNKILEKLEREIGEVDRSEAYVLSQSWQAILDALDTLYDICKDVCVDISTFINLLHLAFLDAKVGTIPTGEDNVLIADASLVRAQGIKHVFVLGANEGTFPANVTGGSIFSDSDKIALETVNINLSEKTDVRADDELMFFKNSIGVASHGAHICALKTGIDGGAKQPSLGYTRILELFSDINEVDVSSLDQISKIYTPTLAREYLSSVSAPLSEAISRELGIFAKTSDFSNEADVVEKETVKEVLGSHLSLSQTKMDTFVTCKFKYYSSYFLNLRSDEKYYFSSREAGTLVHAVFERFLILFKDNPDYYKGLDDSEISSSVDEVVNEYINAVCRGVFLGGKLSHLFQRLRRFLYIFVKKLVDEFKGTKFLPEYLELPFYHGRKDAAEPLTFTLDSGATVSLNGYADRVDTYRTENTTYIRVADYKIGAKNFSESAVESGDGLQLLIYLFSLSKMKDCEFRRKLLAGTENIVPAGFFYVPLNVGKVVATHDLTSSLEDAEKNESEEIMQASAYKGRFLDDEILISAQNTDGSGIYLPPPSGRAKGHYYISGEKFEELYQKMVDSICAIGNEMYRGSAYAEPKKSTTGQDACVFCEWRAFCRRRNK